MFGSRMNSRLVISRVLFIVATSCLLTSSLHAAVERTGSLAASGASAAVTQAVEEKGYRVMLDDGWTADFWFARALATSSNAAAGALYPDVANGEFVGVVTFPKGASDFRGQAISPGTYTLRYQYIPQDANHMGVSPNPDFLLAIPIAADTTPADNTPLKRLVALSAKASSTGHPAVFAMAAAGSPGSISKDSEGMTVLTVAVPTASGKTEKLGVVVKGQATQ
jgi:hypothetical protein